MFLHQKWPETKLLPLLTVRPLAVALLVFPEHADLFKMLIALYAAENKKKKMQTTEVAHSNESKCCVYLCTGRNKWVGSFYNRLHMQWDFSWVISLSLFVAFSGLRLGLNHCIIQITQYSHIHVYPKLCNTVNLFSNLREKWWSWALSGENRCHSETLQVQRCSHFHFTCSTALFLCVSYFCFTTFGVTKSQCSGSFNVCKAAFLDTFNRWWPLSIREPKLGAPTSVNEF